MRSLETADRGLSAGRSLVPEPLRVSLVLLISHAPFGRRQLLAFRSTP